jgi:hypothetical protein
MKLKLSEIYQIPVNSLKPNKKNIKFFHSETGAADKSLLEDIKRRGILVPLILKKDKTILAGHRRRLIAQHLKMKTVPGQYVLQRLTDEQETEFIIKDNLLRRHLSPEERRSLYMRIYKDLKERLLINNKSGMGVDIKKIAEETGLNPMTVNYDINHMRHELRKEINAGSGIDCKNEKCIKAYKTAIVKMLNVAIIDNKATVEALYEQTIDAMNRLDSIKRNRQGEMR